ncbi:MAG: nucleotidyltransferase domain-containing protein [Spirochaetaceae bacterium]
MNVDKIRDIITAHFINDNRILGVYLLGSAYRGEMRSDSDIDLAILFENGCEFSSFDKVTLSGELEILLGRSVDIGILSSKNLVYAAEAFFRGESIYKKDVSKCDIYSSSLIGMYFQLNIDRKEILDAYRA